jgi:LysM repeat protein
MGAYDDGGMTKAINAAKAAGIPTAAASYPATKVTVKRGDTLSEIAAANGLTTKEILDMNPALKSDPKYNGGRTIFSGTKITVDPAYKAPPAPNPSVTKDPVVPPVTKPDPEPDKPKTETKTETETETEIDTTIVTTSSIKSYDGSTSYSSPVVNSVPYAPQLAAVVVTPPPVKTATLDIILFDEESVATDGMFDQIFENIGGQELINITRSDIVNGQKISYQPIKNLSAIQQRYNPNNILSLQQTSDKFFAGFSIKLEDKIPEVGNGLNGENVYLNASGDLVIEFININVDEQVETLISASGTIYEADLGDYAS